AVSPLDLAAYWSAWAPRTAWQGALGVTAAWAALALGPMKASPAKDKLTTWLALALVWVLAALPPPTLARQRLHDAELSAKDIAARYRGDAVKAKNDLVYQYNQIGLRYVFNGGALAGDPGLVQAADKLARSRALFAAYRRDWRTVQAAERSELAKA